MIDTKFHLNKQDNKQTEQTLIERKKMNVEVKNKDRQINSCEILESVKLSNIRNIKDINDNDFDIHQNLLMEMINRINRPSKKFLYIPN